MAQLNLTEAETRLVGQLAGSEIAGHIARTGLPSRRQEAWHYTDLRQLLRCLPELATRADGTINVALPVAIHAPTLSLSHGVLVAQNVPDVWQLKAGLASSRSPDTLVQINHALAPATHRLHVPNTGVMQRLVLDSTSFGKASHSLACVEIELEAGAQLEVIHWVRTDEAAHVVNQDFAARVGEGAHLDHIMMVVGKTASTALNSLHYHVAKQAKLTNLVIHAGPHLVRTQIFAHMHDAGAHADFAGLNLMGETDHGDITLDLDHAVPDTTSKETFKCISKNRGTSIVQGKIKVAPDAQKTNAQMMISGLLLDQTAKILIKPELEIFADDVICAHGATCGELDEEHLFYLMARGIERDQATQLLVKAFAAELIDDVADEGLKHYLFQILIRWLKK